MKKRVLYDIHWKTVTKWLIVIVFRYCCPRQPLSDQLINTIVRPWFQRGPAFKLVALRIIFGVDWKTSMRLSLATTFMATVVCCIA